MTHADALRRILSAQLGPSYPPAYFAAGTPLLGTIPELDSMAVVGILAAMEDEFGITIEDDEISAETFGTFSTLLRFVAERVGNA